jgi:hypothetical protein
MIRWPLGALMDCIYYWAAVFQSSQEKSVDYPELFLVSGFSTLRTTSRRTTGVNPVLDNRLFEQLDGALDLQVLMV